MNINRDVNFNGKTNLRQTLPAVAKPVAAYIALQEGGLAGVRFIQDTATNLVPKATFARSKAELAEETVLELSESALVYCAPALLGEQVFRKIYSRKLPENLKKMVATPAKELLADKKLNNTQLKKLMAVKGAIALSCICIPLTEFCLNYIKNIFTLKVFKEASFDNIASLGKHKKEDKTLQDKVRKSAIKHIAGAAMTFGLALGTSALIAKKGHSSKVLQSLSEFILTPGKKLFKNKKIRNVVDEYFSLEFKNNEGKLALNKGQLTACVLIGGLGYFGAAKDRGKQNFLEVLSRYPLVGFYVITGSSLLEKGFKHILHKKNIFKNLIGNNLEVPTLDNLQKSAEKLAKAKGTSVESEYKKLFKGKSIITGIPTLFSLLFMGFFVAGMSRFWTKKRFEAQESNLKQNNQNKVYTVDAFKMDLSKNYFKS